MSATNCALTPDWVAGRVVLADVRNPIENHGSRGKTRPVVIVRREGSSVVVMGLTTNSTYQSGVPRVPVPNPTAAGLHGRGYLWGDRLTRVCVLDLVRPIGWVDRDLAEAIADLAELVPQDRAALRSASTPLLESA